MESVTRKLATHIRGLLDRLVATEHFSDDEKEEIFDEVIKEARTLPRENVLDLRRRFATSINGRLNGKNRTSPKLLRGSKKLS